MYPGLGRWIISHNLLGAENFPANLIDVQGGPPPAGHRITRSEQDAMRGYQNGPVAPSTGSAQPPRDENANERAAENGSSRESRPYRRNSESSLMGTRSGNLLHAEGRRQKEARQKDAKNRDGKPREGAPSSSTKPKKPNQRLDIIDKLDVTSIYGTGCESSGGVMMILISLLIAASSVSPRWAIRRLQSSPQP